MPIEHIHKVTWPEGVTPMSTYQWVSTLSIEEQNEFAEANKRQEQLRSEVVAQGNLIVASSSYIWKDRAAAEINKPQDLVWLKYWSRYLKETQAIFTIEEKEC
jgi:hypothetical protein